MTCVQLEDSLVEHARGVVVGQGTRAAVESHIEHCTACAARFEREVALTQGLRALAGSVAGAAGPADLESRLMKAFAAHHPAEPAPAASSAGRAWLAYAAAIVILAGAAAAGVQMLRQDPAPQGVQAERVPAAPVPAPAGPPAAAAPVPAAGSGPEAQAPVVADARKPAPRRRQRPLPAPSMDDFIVLPAAAGLPALESGRIVRVELPVASLPAYGVEVISDSSGRDVQADVLVGQDGQPRAIRIVPTGQSSRSKE